MRIAISSRNRLFREGIASILTTRDNCEIVAIASTAKECLAASPHNPPQAVIIDREGSSQADLDFILGAKVYGKFGLVLVASESQVPGFENVIPYDSSGLDLARAVREVAGPEEPYRKQKRRKTPNNPFELTPREYEIALMIGRGLNNKAIAEGSGLKEQTVKNLVGAIMRRLRCNTRVQLALRLAQRSSEQDPTGPLAP